MHDSREQDDKDLDEYVRLLTEHQLNLQSLIMASLGNYSDTADVLQRTNVVLWKKAREFRPGAKFMPWASKVAKYEILAFMRTKRRDRHVFSPELVELMVDVAAERSEGLAERSFALQECIKVMSERNREFLRIRYAQKQSIQQISEKTGRSVEAVKSVYYRIRKSIENCIKRNLVEQLA